MPRTEAQKQWRKTNARLTLDLPKARHEAWKGYAASKGLPLGTMIRQCVEQVMANDGWNIDKVQED